MSLALRLFCIVVVAVGVTACSTQRPASEEKALGTLQSFMSALNHADIDALTSLLAPDATAFLPLDSTPSELVGREAIAAVFGTYFQELRQQGSGPLYASRRPQRAPSVVRQIRHHYV